MIRWQNCVAFETEEAFMGTTEERFGHFYFSNISIQKPNSFPSFFLLEDGYEPWWKPTTKEFMIERCESVLQGYINLINDLKTY